MKAHNPRRGSALIPTPLTAFALLILAISCTASVPAVPPTPVPRQVQYPTATLHPTSTPQPTFTPRPVYHTPTTNLPEEQPATEPAPQTHEPTPTGEPAEPSPTKADAPTPPRDPAATAEPEPTALPKPTTPSKATQLPPETMVSEDCVLTSKGQDQTVHLNQINAVLKDAATAEDHQRLAALVQGTVVTSQPDVPAIRIHIPCPDGTPSEKHSILTQAQQTLAHDPKVESATPVTARPATASPTPAKTSDPQTNSDN